MCCFFQAEDGIRDTSVTGVQTCALPISYDTCVESGCAAPILRRQCGRRPQPQPKCHALRWQTGKPTPVANPYELSAVTHPQIGRASCRERVEDTEGAGAGK